MRRAAAALVILLLLASAARQPASPELEITLVGNAGVQLTDGTTSLLVDLPYESGAFGYQEYDPDALDPPGTVISVITHHHDDHFDPELFAARDGWRLIGPPSVTSGIAAARVLQGDSLRIGAFDVIALRTPHTDDHRSYRIRWGGHVLFFTGDTEDPAALSRGPVPDLLFTSPWLGCSAASSPEGRFGERSIAYHLRARGGDRICGPVETQEQGTKIRLVPK